MCYLFIFLNNLQSASLFHYNRELPTTFFRWTWVSLVTKQTKDKTIALRFIDIATFTLENSRLFLWLKPESNAINKKKILRAPVAFFIRRLCLGDPQECCLNGKQSNLQ
jgi:hypothetical protein